MGTTYYLKDFYNDIKNKQEDLINNHSKSCQTGGFTVLNKQFEKLNAQQQLNEIRREVQSELNNKINNIKKHMLVGGGKGEGDGKMTLSENIKLLKQKIREQCKIEKNLLKNIKKQQKCIKQNKLEFLPSYQSEFKDEIKRANTMHKDIKKMQAHINKIIAKKEIKQKNKETDRLLSIKQEEKIATLNNLKSIIDNIKQR
jgi:hypothetical protein